MQEINYLRKTFSQPYNYMMDKITRTACTTDNVELTGGLSPLPYTSHWFLWTLRSAVSRHTRFSISMWASIFGKGLFWKGLGTYYFFFQHTTYCLIKVIDYTWLRFIFRTFLIMQRMLNACQFFDWFPHTIIGMSQRILTDDIWGTIWMWL